MIMWPPSQTLRIGWRIDQRLNIKVHVTYLELKSLETDSGTSCYIVAS